MVKIATIIFIVMLAYAGAYSIGNLVVPQVFVSSSFQIIADEELKDVQNKGYVEAYLGMSRTSSMFALVTVIAGFFILFGAFRKKEKWAWWGFLIGAGIAWIWGVAFSIVIGDTFYLTLQLIGLVLLIVGILLPVKAFFGKKV
ncbi:MAG: hypothetical protein ACYSR9_11180 [Planctomycetota bacterium]|jgi:hypothetical protein